MSLVKSIGSKKVNFDFNKNFINTFIEKINSSDLQFINQTLKDLHPSDVANLIENLPEETRVKLIEIESFNLARPRDYNFLVLFLIKMKKLKYLEIKNLVLAQQ